jgi:hypothetical protein
MKRLPANHAKSRKEIRFAFPISSIRVDSRYFRANLLCLLFVLIRAHSWLKFE